VLVRAAAPVCVCEFTVELELPQQNISCHLEQLVDAGVIARERRGRYSEVSGVTRIHARSLARHSFSCKSGRVTPRRCVARHRACRF
jgi:DNA-binding transcriptional ArsR family regulator